MSQETKQLYEFGRFTLDVEESRLLRDGQPVSLKPKVLETLLVLVENTGHIQVKGRLPQASPISIGDGCPEHANLAPSIHFQRQVEP